MYETTFELISSAFYFQNFSLHSRGQDYFLAAEHSPLMHFWSLSIEEQFYIGFPFIVLAFGLVGGILKIRSREFIFAGILIIFTISLGASLYYGVILGADVYYLSQVRFWELAAGGLLSFAPKVRFDHRVSEAISWFCISGLVACIFLIDASMAFPGAVAVAPVALAAGFIYFSDTQRSWTWRLAIRNAGFRSIGDWSYSIYLVHWPVIFFYLRVADAQLSAVEGIVLAAASIGLGAASYYLIEQPFRGRHHQTRTVVAPLGVAAIALPLLAAGAAYLPRLLNPENGMQTDHPGALVLTDGVAAPENVDFVPSLRLVRDDRADVYGDGCQVRPEGVVPIPCRYGPGRGGPVIALLGNSHAASFVPAFQELAERNQGTLIVHTKSACRFVLETARIGRRPYTECSQWVAAVIDTLREDAPDFVVVSYSSGGVAYGPGEDTDVLRERFARSARDTLAQLRDAGLRVIVLRNNPRMDNDAPQCLAGGGDCITPRVSALSGDDLAYQAATELGVPVVDMTDAFCTQTECPPVIGNVLVWRDSGHFTATFSRTLANELERRFALAAEQASD
ncbi:MAG: O-antigen acetylase [Oceanicaulis sp. HLUCCA04]|nr:MAG: O-antigen acetylase [Oceanicaulis sp. HLUCCA04]